jgi:hypothetical protein
LPYRHAKIKSQFLHSGFLSSQDSKAEVQVFGQTIVH